MNRRHPSALALTALLAVALFGCQRDGGDRGRSATTQPAAHHERMWESVDRAVAVLHPTQGNNARGTVHFTQTGNRVRVRAHVEGLEPNSTHGFHIHEYGDCTAPDATSAGSHYNPQGHPHAGPDTRPRHAGDLGNLTANAQGVADLELTVDNITIAGMKNPVIGRAVIVHAKADDLTSQPTGDAGDRIACGVIGVANPQGRR